MLSIAESRKLVNSFRVYNFKSRGMCYGILASLDGVFVTHTHTQPFYILRLCGFCPGQSGWAGTRRNIHPLTPIVVVPYASSIYYDPFSAC